MDIVNFDALKAQDKIINPIDVDPEEDYFILGKKNVHYTTNSMKATNYPIWAIKAGDVMGTLAVKSVTGLNTDNTDPLNPIVQISVDGVTITGSGTPTDPLVSVASGDTKSVTNITPTNNIVLTTTANKNYFILGYIDGNVLPAINIFLTNLGTQAIGDQIIIISQPDTTIADIDICYDPSQFYLTRCGGPTSPVCSNFNDGTPERDVTIFTYDGSIFCATYDNC